MKIKSVIKTFATLGNKTFLLLSVGNPDSRSLDEIAVFDVTHPTAINKLAQLRLPEPETSARGKTRSVKSRLLDIVWCPDNVTGFFYIDNTLQVFYGEISGSSVQLKLTGRFPLPDKSTYPEQSQYVPPLEVDAGRLIVLPDLDVTTYNLFFSSQYQVPHFGFINYKVVSSIRREAWLPKIAGFCTIAAPLIRCDPHTRRAMNSSEAEIFLEVDGFAYKRSIGNIAGGPCEQQYSMGAVTGSLMICISTLQRISNPETGGTLVALDSQQISIQCHSGHTQSKRELHNITLFGKQRFLASISKVKASAREEILLEISHLNNPVYDKMPYAMFPVYSGQFEGFPGAGVYSIITYQDFLKESPLFPFRENVELFFILHDQIPQFLIIIYNFDCSNPGLIIISTTDLMASIQRQFKKNPFKSEVTLDFTTVFLPSCHEILVINSGKIEQKYKSLVYNFIELIKEHAREEMRLLLKETTVCQQCGDFSVTRDRKKCSQCAEDDNLNSYFCDICFQQHVEITHPNHDFSGLITSTSASCIERVRRAIVSYCWPETDNSISAPTRSSPVQDVSRSVIESQPRHIVPATVPLAPPVAAVPAAPSVASLPRSGTGAVQPPLHMLTGNSETGRPLRRRTAGTREEMTTINREQPVITHFASPEISWLRSDKHIDKLARENVLFADFLRPPTGWEAYLEHYPKRDYGAEEMQLLSVEEATAKRLQKIYSGNNLMLRDLYITMLPYEAMRVDLPKWQHFLSIMCTGEVTLDPRSTSPGIKKIGKNFWEIKSQQREYGDDRAVGSVLAVGSGNNHARLIVIHTFAKGLGKSHI